MTNEELNVKINRYVEVSEEYKKAEAEKKALAAEIAKEIEIRKIDYFETPDENVVTYTTKTTFKYNEEDKMIEYLKTHGEEALVITTIDTTPLNEKLKDATNKTLVESLTPYFTKSITYTTTIQTKAKYLEKLAKYGKKENK